MEIRIVKESISKTTLKAIAEDQFGDFVKAPPMHKNLAAGRWHTLSLAEQLGNIGSEVGRAGHAQACRKLSLRQYQDDARFHGAVDRALELFNLTLADPRWHGRLREIGRAYEIFCDAVLGGTEYGSSLADLEGYFMQFAMAARRK